MLLLHQRMISDVGHNPRTGCAETRGRLPGPDPGLAESAIVDLWTLCAGAGRLLLTVIPLCLGHIRLIGTVI